MAGPPKCRAETKQGVAWTATAQGRIDIQPCPSGARGKPFSIRIIRPTRSNLLKEEINRLCLPKDYLTRVFTARPKLNENHLYFRSNPINCAYIGQDAGLEFCLIQCSFLAGRVVSTSILVLLTV